MVLNSRFQIIGGRDTYESPTNMSITTTMIRNITSQLAEGTRPVDAGMQGWAPESFDNNHETAEISVSHNASCALLELIFP